MRKRAIFISGMAAIAIAVIAIIGAILAFKAQTKKDRVRMEGPVPIYSAEQSQQAKDFLKDFVQMRGTTLEKNENLIVQYDLREDIENLHLWNQFYEKVANGEEAAVVYASYSWEAQVDVIYISYCDDRFYLLYDYTRDGYSPIGSSENPYREEQFDDLQLPGPVDLEAIEAEKTVVAASQEVLPELDRQISDILLERFSEGESQKLFCAEAHMVQGTLEYKSRIEVFVYGLCQSFETPEKPKRGEYYIAQLTFSKTEEGGYGLQSFLESDDRQSQKESLMKAAPDFAWEFADEYTGSMELSLRCQEQADQYFK